MVSLQLGFSPDVRRRTGAGGLEAGGVWLLAASTGSALERRGERHQATERLLERLSLEVLAPPIPAVGCRGVRLRLDLLREPEGKAYSFW